jgi:hypothetical protein
MQKLPLGKTSAHRVVVKYPAEGGGYTPGDTWELYVGADKRVQEFIYHRGGPKKPSLVIATWAGYKKAGPTAYFNRSPRHGGRKAVADFLSDVSVKVTGSETWINAQ